MKSKDDFRFGKTQESSELENLECEPKKPKTQENNVVKIASIFNKDCKDPPGQKVGLGADGGPEVPGVLGGMWLPAAQDLQATRKMHHCGTSTCKS